MRLPAASSAGSLRLPSWATQSYNNNASFHIRQPANNNNNDASPVAILGNRCPAPPDVASTSPERTAPKSGPKRPSPRPTYLVWAGGLGALFPLSFVVKGPTLVRPIVWRRKLAHCYGD